MTGMSARSSLVFLSTTLRAKPAKSRASAAQVTGLAALARALVPRLSGARFAAALGGIDHALPDRLLALRFGAAAVRLVEKGRFNVMAALDPPRVLAVPLAEAARRMKSVPLDSDTVLTARDLGVSFGD